MKKVFLPIIVIVFYLGGCQSAPKAKNETNRDVQEAITSIAEAVSGQELSEEDARRLQHQIRTDKEAQSALKSITNSMSGQNVVVKFCPETGKRYAAKLEKCPVHGVELEILEDENGNNPSQ